MKILLSFLSIIVCFTVEAQLLSPHKKIDKQAFFRGTNTSFRNWWNVTKYKLEIQPNFNQQTIQGSNIISFKIPKKPAEFKMQIDLQKGMNITSIDFQNKSINPKRQGDIYWITLPKIQTNPEETYQLKILFEGQPRIAKNPPWDGGWIFKKDQLNRPWMAVACQGLGASAWYPCKDYQGDEPDLGMTLDIHTPKNLIGVANGRFQSKKNINDSIDSYQWKVLNPINNYNIIPQIGNYVNFKDTYKGLKGNLDLDYWVMDYNLEKAKKQFVQSKKMLEAFEFWIGPYPFYEDSFKLIETPHLGMEHQSGIAYGNHFKNGYLGRDLSNTGWGMKFDFIIIHEAGHEWYGNNITTKDIADMWVHESFTAYSESLFLDYHYGTQAANEYTIGTRQSIQNDIPIIGIYGQNKEGSGDMYYKGANMLHSLRQWVNDDSKFREMLRNMYREFYHQTVDGKQIELFMASYLDKDLSAFFEQYLRTIKIPVIEYKIQKNKVKYRYKNTVKKFNMPLKVNQKWIYPNKKWQTLKNTTKFNIDPNFLVKSKEK